jgi:beta-glucosidase
MPFMLAQKYANPWAYMTAYNKLNGLHCSENPALLRDILRKEWKFDGMVRRCILSEVEFSIIFPGDE